MVFLGNFFQPYHVQLLRGDRVKVVKPGSDEDHNAAVILENVRLLLMESFA